MFLTLKATVVELFQEQIFLKNALSSALLLVCILTLRAIINRSIRKSSLPNKEDRRNWIGIVRNFAIAIFVLGLLAIWAAELRTFAVSLVAVAAAIVIAIKEVLICFMGGVYKLSSRPFRIGDRISVKTFRGDVMDHNLLTTTLMEIGPDLKGHQYTGRKVTLPNSLFLVEPILNESLTSQYSFHTIIIPIKEEQDRAALEKKLLEIAKAECSSIVEEAKRHLLRLENQEVIEVPSVDPRVTLHIPEPGRIDLILRVPAPVSRKGAIEQAILRKFFNTPA